MSWLERLRLVSATNGARALHHLPALRTHPELMAIAQHRAWQVRGDFTHDRAGVPDMWWGECLAWSVPAVHADQVVAWWLASAEHRPIVLGRWAYLGAGETDSGGRRWWTLVVGHR